jgi:Fe-S-cluster-containing dehydrogenase component
MPCPICVKFVPHEWEQNKNDREMTCTLCATVVRSAEELKAVRSCPGPTPERATSLRAQKLRDAGVGASE